MASWLVSVIKRRNVKPICEKYPPVFFTEEQIRKMEKTPGSYKYKGDAYGKAVKTY